MNVVIFWKGIGNMWVQVISA